MKRALLLLPLILSCNPNAGYPKGPKADPVDPKVGDLQPKDPVTVPPVQKPRALAIATPKLLAQPLATDTAKVTIHRLSNGMTVYIAPDSQEPSITAHIAVKAGSANDPEISTGLAHYLEHMLFKGTSKLGTLDYAKEKPILDGIAQLYADLRKPGADRAKILASIDAETQKAAEFAVPNELDQMYAQLGVTGLNAYTSEDATVYVTDIPKNRVAQWAKVEVARYSDAVFRLFWPELEAVYEEKNRGMDSAPRRVNEEFLRALFPKHGYGRPTLGFIDHLKSPAYGDMVAFYNRYYTPQNMAILLSGDVDASVLPLLEKEFAAFTRPPGEVPDPGQLVPISGRQVSQVKVPSDPGVFLGWHLPAAAAKDRDAVQLMDLLLLDGESGILARDLLIPQKVADAGCGPSFQRDASYYQMYADALDGQTNDDLEKMLLELVGKVQRGEFTDTDLATAILTAEIQQSRQLESNQGRMGLMEQAFINGEEWESVVGRIDRFKKITKDDIVRVAKQYLTPNFVVVQKVLGSDPLPKITKPGITPVKVDTTRKSAFRTDIIAMPAPPIEPVAITLGKDFTRGKLVTGDLISVANTRNNLFSISYSYDFGRRNDRLACFALQTLKVSGSGKQSADQVARQLHELGLSVDVGCNKSSSSITLSGIDRNMEKGQALLAAWLGDAAIDDQTLAARVAFAINERTNEIKSPPAISGAASAYARFDAESDSLVVPTNKALQAAKPAQIKKLLAGYLKLKHRTSFFGPQELGSKLVALGDGKTPTQTIPTIKYRKPGSVIVVDQETAQTQIWMTWPRAAATAADRAAGTLYSEYISPLLYQEIREARGLAYTVYGGYGTGWRKTDPAAGYLYIGTQGDKSHDAIGAILDVLAKPVDDNRLGIAKETIEQSNRVDRIPPRAIASAVYQWDDEGEKADPRIARTKAALAVDKATLEKWIKGLVGSGKILSLTGDKKKLDPAKLKALGPVTDVPISKLFGY